MRFRERQSLKAMFSAIGACGLLYALLHGNSLRYSDFGQAHPWLSIFMLMLGLTTFQVLGGMTLYYLQNSGSNGPGQTLSREEFIKYLESDHRFVLYLRNFATEAGAQLAPRLTQLPDQPAPRLTFTPQTLPGIEHALSYRFGAKNRLFAVENRRADTVPIFDLVICDNDTWRSTVVIALQKARLVVLAIEVETAGVLEEIAMVGEYAAERTWLIYSESVEAWLEANSSNPLRKTRWQSSIPSHQSLRTLYHLNFPNDVLRSCNASEA